MINSFIYCIVFVLYLKHSPLNLNVEARVLELFKAKKNNLNEWNESEWESKFKLLILRVVIGTCLMETGEAHRALAEHKYSLEESVKINFIEPLLQLAAKDLKEIAVCTPACCSCSKTLYFKLLPLLPALQLLLYSRGFRFFWLYTVTEHIVFVVQSNFMPQFSLDL